MSWRHPKRLPVAGDVVDFEDLNESVRHVHDELGNLNEHNLSAELQTELTSADYEDSTLTRYAKIQRTSTNFGQLGASNGSDFFLYSVGTWSVIDGLTTDGLTYGGIRTSGGLVRITVSYQVMLGQGGRMIPSWYIPGIEVDGRVIVESQRGDLDSNYSGASSELGYGGVGVPIKQTVVLRLAPGHHTVRAVGKIERGAKFYDEDRKTLANPFDTTTEYYVGSHLDYVAIANGVLYIREDR